MRCRTKLSDEAFLKQFKKETNREVNDELLDVLDDMFVDNEMEDELKRQIIRFSKTVKEVSNVSSIDYVKACYFVSLYAQGLTQEQAYRKVFPDRVAKKREGTSTIANSANSYFHTMTVQNIWKQVSVADSVHFVDMRYRSYAVLDNIMMNPESTNKEKIEAASKLANLLKPPKEAMVRVDVGVHGDELKALDQKLAEIAQAQINLLSNGKITNNDIVEAELVLKDDDEQY